jgi:hypothetical protein
MGRVLDRICSALGLKGGHASIVHTNLIARAILFGGLMSLTDRPELAQSIQFAIEHVTVINPGDAKSQPDRTIIVSGSTIKAVFAGNTFKSGASVRIINGRGKFVIPGLWDMHMHFRDANRDLKMDVANGVLGIRNMGGVANEVLPLRDAILKEQAIGPKIVACGPIIDGPDSWSNPKFTISVTNAEEARAAVRSLKEQGTDCIKVYDGLSRESYFAIIDEAKNLELPVVGHLPNPISVREAAQAGQRTIEHGVVLAGGATNEDAYIQRRLDQSAFQEALLTKNFSLIPAKIAHDDTMMLDHFSQSRADETYSLLAKDGTFITPTMVTERALIFPDKLIKEEDPRMQHASAEELNYWKPEDGALTKYRTPEYITVRKREYELMLKEIPSAMAKGVHLLAGTDITVPFTYPGFSLHDELALFVSAGLTPSQALETATVNPALLLGLSKEWGRVAPGYSANFVLLDADPLIDINNTKDIDAVILNGKFMDRIQLNQILHDAQVPNEKSASR